MKEAYDHIINILSRFGAENIKLDTPPNPSMGDYAFGCFVLAKKERKAPDIIADDLAKKIKSDRFIEKVVAVGPYINFYINRSLMIGNALTITEHKKRSENIIIDYSAPNIAKPFSIAHLRSTGIGNALYNIYRFLGYNTVGINHIGDWGTQFGKLIYAYKQWGVEKKLEKSPINYLLELYVKFHDEAEKNKELEDFGRNEFMKLENKDKENIALWKKFKKLSLKEFERVYERLGVSFDSWDGEAFYDDKIEDIVLDLTKKDLLTDSDGARIVDLEDKGMSPFIAIKSDGTSIYATRDLAAIKYRFKKYSPDRIIYVVDSRQSLHFEQLFEVSKRLGYKDVFEHVKFGLLKFPDGAFSTRKGKIIFLEDVLDKSVELVKKIIEEKNPELKNKDKVAEMVGVGAIEFFNLKNDRVTDIIFKWDDVLNFEGETGPYLQYTHARICSIIRKTKKNAKIDPDVLKDLLNTKEDTGLISLLNGFDEVLENVIKSNKPHLLCRWLLDLAQSFNTYYNKNKVIQDDKNLECARIQLITSVRDHLKKGLELLGLKAPEEM